MIKTNKINGENKMNFKQEMQKAKMNFLRIAELKVKSVHDLKWVNGTLFYKGTDTEFTVKELLK